MAHYHDEKIMQAFQIYTKLSAEGNSGKDDNFTYLTDGDVRALLDQFATSVDCDIISVGDMLYLIPISSNSVFHVSNEYLKKEYFSAKAVNLDLYMMYLSIIILIGEFYDSYQTTEVTRDFITITEWLDTMNERISALGDIEPERLKALEKEYEYNWCSLIEKWEAMDDIKENVQQTARTQSRLAFINIVRRFLNENGLVKELGNDEIALSEKAKIIVQRHYMKEEYNRGILEFIYDIEQKMTVMERE